jgi:hypothetical protein
LSAWRRRSVSILESVAEFIGKWPATILCIPSIYLLTSYPPLWKDVDAIVQLTLPASVENIEHYPPIYSFLGRVPFFITAWMQNIGIQEPFRSIFEQQEPSLAGIYLLLILQHLTLIAALTYTSMSMTSNRKMRCLFAVLLGSFSALYTHAHCCGSEALSLSATVALFAAGASIVRCSGSGAWIVYSTALFLAVGSRHLNLVFCLWLPISLICAGLATKFGWCSAQCNAHNGLRTIFMATFVGILTVASTHWIAETMMAVFHDEYRTTIGRTLSDRVASFLDDLPSNDRIQLAHDLSAKTPNPLVRTAIEAQATTGSFYNGTSEVITNELLRAAFTTWNGMHCLF